ncbi:MAG: GGDEF domain-containing protein [Burkholderiaceae bacterium]
MLNEPTLLLVLIVFTTVTTLLLSAAAMGSDAIAEQRLWALGSIFASLGFAVGALTDFPMWVHAGVSYALIGFGLALVLRGLRLFFGQPLSWSVIGGITLVAFAWPAYYAVVTPDKGARVLVSGLYLGAITWICAATVVRGVYGRHHAAMWATAGGFALVGSVMVARAIYLLVAGTGVGSETIATIAEVSLLAVAVAQVTIAFGLTMLVSHRHSEKLSRLTMMDGLTGTLNRIGMEQLGERVLMRAGQGKRSVSLAMVDADFFKAINDTHGHPAGDQVLVHLARLLIAQVRPGDLVIRFGGEEFVLLLDGTGLEAARQAAERLRKIVDNASVATGVGEIRYQVSIGVSCTDQVGHDLHRLLASADAALYRAKQEGRNRVCVGTTA